MKRIVVVLFAALVAFSASAAEMMSVEASEVNQVFKKSKKEIKEVVFYVHLHCKSCVKKIEENISFEKGVKGLEVSMEKNSITIKYDSSKTSDAALKAALEKLGFKVNTKPIHHE